MLWDETFEHEPSRLEPASGFSETARGVGSCKDFIEGTRGVSGDCEGLF